MANANVEYWRTFRNYQSNTVIIADQPQDVITFRGGNNIDLTFNAGQDTITWEANVPGLANNVKQEFSVVNSTVATLSTLTYDDTSGIFTYNPPDLSTYTTKIYVDSKVTSEISNIDLSSYATETWVQGYVGTSVNIPDLSYYASNAWVNQWGSTLNTAISNIPRGYTGSQGPQGNASTVPGFTGSQGNAVVAGHFVYHQTTPSNVWMINHHLGQRYLNVEVIDVQDKSLSGTYGYPTVTFLDTCNVSVEWQANTVGTVVLSSGGGQQGPKGFTGSQGERGYTGSIGYTGSQGTTGYNGSQGIMGYTGSAGVLVEPYVYEQNVSSNSWVITHNLGIQYLNVEIIDLANSSITGTYDYPTIVFDDPNTCTINWNYSATGRAILSAGHQGDVGYTGSTGTSEVTTVYTYATLPSASTGSRSFISDSSVSASGNFGNIAVSGGAFTVPVYYDGTTWRIG